MASGAYKMRMGRIPWREAKRRFHVLRCRGCPMDDFGQDWYVELNSAPINGPYCSECAVKLAGEHDAAHSETTFFTDTRGTRWKS